MACQEGETIVATVRNGQEAINVARDEGDTSPREWTNLGVISMCADRTVGGHPWLGEETYHVYGCEDDSDRPGRCGEELFADTLAHLPLFVDDWGWKTVIRTARNRSDEVPDGYIYATAGRAADMGCISKRTGRPSAAAATRMLRSEIAAYNQYLAGEVYMARLVRTNRCDRGAEHVEVLDDVHGVYPPYDAHIDRNGRLLYRAPEEAGINPADHVVRMYIEDSIAAGESDARAVLGWYKAASLCADLSRDARIDWKKKTRALETGIAGAGRRGSTGSGGGGGKGLGRGRA